MHRSAGPRRAYSLLEIIIVVMIIGIMATIAAPKLLGTSQQAVDNGLRHSLDVIRTAIDSYAAENLGALPGADGLEQTFQADLDRYLRGSEFPVCPVGAAKNGAVRMWGGSGTIASTMGATATTHSWVYQYKTGDFHVNCLDLSADGVTTYDQF